MPAVSNVANVPFLNIVNGRFAQRVEEGTPGAVARVNKLGAKVFEIYFQAWRGIVKGWSIQDSDYGTTLHVNFDDVTLSLNGKMMSEFIKKFSSADTEKEITVSPYPEFAGKNGIPVKSGLTIIQDGERLYNHFSEYDKETQKFTYKNGYPEPQKEWSQMTETDKKVYYAYAEEFLRNWVNLHPINSIPFESTDEDIDDMVSKEDAGVQLDKVPF